ncbi:MAG: RHS domain-containing protein, partial [Spirochaetia bacterium]
MAVRRKADGSTEETLIARYTYDEAGFRIKKDSTGKGVTWYVESAGGSVLYEEKGDGEYKEFVYAFGRHFAKVEGKLGGDGSERKKYFYHTDHLGSTIAVTNAAGEVVWRNDYTPFGGLTGEYGTEEHDAKYTGKDLDTETGLYYFNAR